MQLKLFTKYVIISVDSNKCKIFIYFPLYVSIGAVKNLLSRQNRNPTIRSLWEFQKCAVLPKTKSRKCIKVLGTCAL